MRRPDMALVNAFMTGRARGGTGEYFPIGVRYGCGLSGMGSRRAHRRAKVDDGKEPQDDVITPSYFFQMLYHKGRSRQQSVFS